MAGAFLAASSGMMTSSTDYVPIEIDDQTQELRVPEDHIGAIIGKGGKRINEVRQLSGCKGPGLIFLSFYNGTSRPKRLFSTLKVINFNIDMKKALQK